MGGKDQGYILVSRSSDDEEASQKLSSDAESCLPTSARAKGNVQPEARRTDIDGLRSVAVLGVILFHMNPTWLPGGFSGVDMFFCISGFVNTASLVHGQGAGKGVFDFYGRRMWRIAPALMVNVLLTCVFMCVLLPPDLLALMSYFISGWLGLVGLVNNYFASMKLDYFERGHKDLELNPFTHLWSLGVEEQFYVLFPLFIRSTEWCRVAFVMLAVCTIASALASGVLTASNGQFAFYTLPSRFWELAIGACVFHLVQTGPSRTAQSLSQILALLCLPAALLCTPSSPGFPFPWASLSVGGAACFMVAGSQPSSILNSGLSNMVAVYIGRLSYSLYLWHWPVFVFFRYTLGLESSGCRLAALAITTILSMATYHLLEKPLARNRPQTTWKVCTMIVAFLSLTALALLALALPLRGALYVEPPETPSVPVHHNASHPGHNPSHRQNHTQAWELCPGPGQWSRRRAVRWVPDSPSTCSMEYAWQERDNPPHHEIVLLGDSTMQRLHLSLGAATCNDIPKVSNFSQGGRCDVMEFLNMKRSPVWKEPAQWQGPTEYGLAHPFCLDCDVNPRRLQCNMRDAEGHRRAAHVEYIPIDFVQDVALQSMESSTSQGTVGEYLCRKDQPASVFVNDGIHDTCYINNLPVETYVEHWRFFITQLKRCAKEIIWLTMNSIQPLFYGDSALVAKMNEAVYKMLTEEHPDIFTLDVFKMSQLATMHADALHMNDQYYLSLQQIVFTFATRED